MRRSVRTRLTVALATGATTAVLGGLLAPAASADPGPSDAVLQHLRTTSSNAPGVVPNVPPFGRKLV